MNKSEFILYCINELSINDNQINQLISYKELIQEYNQKFNLTRLDDESIIYDSFFLESILPFKKMNFNPEINQSILDIGTGAGIPGILLKIIYPNLSVSLLESNTKKCLFLSIVIDKLNLKDIDIINDRAESYIKKQNQYESYDYVTSRAVSELKNILELSVGYCKVNGLIIQPKSKKYSLELENANWIMNETNIKLIDNIFYEFNDKQNNILVFKKIQKTNKLFPREWNKISKK